MTATKILNDEIKDLKISSLPSRPNAETKYGGYGYSAANMKDAFDALALFIIKRYNALIDDIHTTEGGICESIKTGISEEHTLSDFFDDVTSGALSSYLTLFEKTLAEHVRELYDRIEALESALASARGTGE